MVAIPTVPILVLILPKIAGLAWAETTGLIAVLPAESSTLVKASVSVCFEAASKILPAVAVIEAVVKALRNLLTVAEGLPVPVSCNPSIASVVLRPASRFGTSMALTGAGRDGLEWQSEDQTREYM